MANRRNARRWFRWISETAAYVLIGAALIALNVWLACGCIAVPKQLAGAGSQQEADMAAAQAIGLTEQQRSDIKMVLEEAAIENAMTGGRDVKINTGGLIGMIQAVGVVLLLLTYPAGKLIWLFVGGARRRLGNGAFREGKV